MEPVKVTQLASTCVCQMRTEELQKNTFASLNLCVVRLNPDVLPDRLGQSLLSAGSYPGSRVAFTFRRSRFIGVLPSGPLMVQYMPPVYQYNKRNVILQVFQILFQHLIVDSQR